MDDINPTLDLNSVVIDRIKKIRSDLGLNQRQFSELIHVSPSVYSRIEKGERQLTLNFIQKISEKTDYNLAKILDISGNIYHVENQKGLQNQCNHPVLNIKISEKQFEDLKEILK